MEPDDQKRKEKRDRLISNLIKQFVNSLTQQEQKMLKFLPFLSFFKKNDRKRPRD